VNFISADALPLIDEDSQPALVSTIYCRLLEKSPVCNIDVFSQKIVPRHARSS
jgi:hypothetical protein